MNAVVDVVEDVLVVVAVVDDVIMGLTDDACNVTATTTTTQRRRKTLAFTSILHASWEGGKRESRVPVSFFPPRTLQKSSCMYCKT